MKAIISDIHSNIEALEAVLEDIRAHDIEEILVLGDVIGYGPNPKECLNLIREVKPLAVLMGNHEHALLHGCPENMNPRASRTIEWTAKQLDQDDLDFLGSLGTEFTIDGIMAIHASPRNHVLEYIFPFDIKKKDKMNEIFSLMNSPRCVVGHVHIPGVFTENLEFISPSDLMSNLYLFGEEKAVINVGSVGQPRDLNNKACYVTLDEDGVIFRRVAYDYKKTQEKILAIDCFDPFLAKRLGLGR